MARFEREPKEFIEKVVYLNRVSKTVKGGRVSKFSALVVVGDGKGTVGYGLGKAAEVSEAIIKGIADAKKNMVKVSLSGNTIPHDVIGIFGAGTVLLKPAPEGTGVIAGGAVRAVMEAVGIKNICAKCMRSNNPQNVVKATMAGLMTLRSPEQVAAVRGKVNGTPERPRLNVFRSETNIYAQIIDDTKGITLVSASSLEKGFEGATGNAEAAKKVGLTIAERAKEKGITEVVFDRGGYVYHGRVAALADGAREAGLKF